MKAIRIILGLLLTAVLIAGGWIVLFHSDWIKRPPAAEEPEPVSDIPVRVGKITRATLHRYIECFGTVTPAQLTSTEIASTARIAAPVGGVVSTVNCFVGQRVEKGATLFQLSETSARAEVAKQEAALASARAAQLSAQASLNKLKASTRPEQIALAEIALKKAQQAVAVAAKNHARQQALANEELASAKQLEETAAALDAARQDQTSAEKQLTLLKNTPAPEDIAEAEAKIAETTAKITEAEKALAAAKIQSEGLTVKAPLTATVVKMNAYPGEYLDVTNVVVELVDLNRLEISALVSANDLQDLKKGEAVEIYCATTKPSIAGTETVSEDAATIKPISSTLSGFGLQVDPKTNLSTVFVAVPPNAGVLPGQHARLRIAVEERPNCLVAPEESVFRDRTNISVIAVVENGKSSLQNARPGLRENGLVEVRGEDLKEGMEVVTSGSYGIKTDETKIHIINDDAKPPAGSGNR